MKMMNNIRWRAIEEYPTKISHIDFETHKKYRTIDNEFSYGSILIEYDENNNGEWEYFTSGNIRDHRKLKVVVSDYLKYLRDWSKETTMTDIIKPHDFDYFVETAYWFDKFWEIQQNEKL